MTDETQGLKNALGQSVPLSGGLGLKIDINAQLMALRGEWLHISGCKFASAKQEKTEFGKRFIEHGAICYFNCARALEKILKTGDTFADFDFEPVQQDAERPRS